MSNLEKLGNMEDYLRAENAKLREQLESLVMRHQYALEAGAEIRQRAEAAEAKLKVASEQEPVYMYRRLGLENWVSCGEEQYAELSEHKLFDTCKLYTAPIPPADVQGDKEYIAALQRQRVAHEERIAEQECKLAEQREEECRQLLWRDARIEELNTLLAQAREEGRKVGMLEAVSLSEKYLTSSTAFETELRRRAMLAAAPTLEAKP